MTPLNRKEIKKMFWKRILYYVRHDEDYNDFVDDLSRQLEGQDKGIVEWRIEEFCETMSMKNLKVEYEDE